MDFHENEEITNYVNLFVSVIICFPEITTIKYDRDQDTLHFSFILKGKKEAADITSAIVEMQKAYGSYHRLSGDRSTAFSVSSVSMGEFTVLETKRSMKSVTHEEIGFLVELFRNQFGDSLVIESVDPEEEDFRWLDKSAPIPEGSHKRIKFDEKSIGNNILVCREAGKVLVFSNS